jgi:hypothetical protein
MIHVALHSVGTYHKKFGGQKASFAECPTKGTRQRVRHSANPAIPVVRLVYVMVYLLNKKIKRKTPRVTRCVTL